MNFEPKKFFIGVIDFFSVLLPGALLVCCLYSERWPEFLVVRAEKLNDTAWWLAFLFASYVLGHFIFLVGAALLDDFLYDPVRGATREKQDERRARKERPSPAVLRLLARILIKEGADDTQRRAVKIKEHYVDPLGARSSLNAFQWCKARLTLENRGEALEAVQRFEADSKFFRSFAVVIFALIVWQVAKGNRLVGLAGVPFLALALWRYIDQRLKAINQAYWYIIAVEAANPAGYRAAPEEKKPGPNRAGGVVYRHTSEVASGGHRGAVEYLIVQAKNDPREWVLPKGHIEPDEKTTETAAREVFEETGVCAQIRHDLGTISFDVTNETVRTQFFLMEAMVRGKRDEARMIRWVPFGEAIAALRHEESRDLLRHAQAALTAAASGNRAPQKPI